MNLQLEPFELWAVKNHLRDIRAKDVSVKTRVNQLRANGYPRIADAVDQFYTANVYFGKGLEYGVEKK